MKSINDILKEWEKDSEIGSDIMREVQRTPYLHAKYLKLFVEARSILKQLKNRHDLLVADMTDYYLGEMDIETMKSLGLAPWPRKVLKNDLKRFLDRDPRIQENLGKITQMEEMVSLLKDIMDSINQRAFLLNTAVKYMQFVNGE